jgi:hypothetical protein
MWNKKETPKTLDNAVATAATDSKTADKIVEVNKKLANGEINGPAEYFNAIQAPNVVVVEKEELKKSYPETNELADVLAKALNDSLGFLPAGGSVRSTVDKALAKYNESKK